VDYRKQQIQTLTKTANRTPQFASPSNSLGTDVVNAIGTGLQFLQQNQAQAKLETLKQEDEKIAMAQKARESWVTEQSVAYGDMLLELEANRVSPNTLSLKKNQFFKNMNAEDQADITSSLRSRTNETAFTSLTRLQSLQSSASSQEIAKAQEARAVEKHEAQQRKDARDAEEAREARVNSAYQTQVLTGGSTLGVENMDDIQLRKIELKGIKYKTEKQVQATARDEALSKAQNEQEIRQINSKYYLDTNADTILNIGVSGVVTKIEELGGVTSANMPVVIDWFNEAQLNLDGVISDAVNRAEGEGTPMTLEDQTALRQRMTQSLSTLKSVVTDATMTTAMNNMPKVLGGEAILKGMASDKEEVRKASNLLMIKLGTGEQLTMTDVSTHIRLVAETLSGNPDFNADAGILASPLSTPDMSGKFSDSAKEGNRKVIEGLLDNTPTNVKKFVKDGGLHKVLIDISKYKGENIALQDREYVAGVLEDKVSKYIGGSLSRAVNASGVKVLGSAGLMSGTASVPVNAKDYYRLNPENLQLEFIGDSSILISRDFINTYNKYVSDYFKSMEYLGKDEDEIQAIREDLATSIMVTGVVEPDKKRSSNASFDSKGNKINR